jgi:DNA gyrase/topoisomerase IV subunit B
MSKEEFKILSARDHVRLRTGMYLGSVSQEKVERFILGEWKPVTYVPALLKMIDEIIDNSIDEAIRTGFKYANKIDVSINGNKISITDNGRGIPQEVLKDPQTNKDILRPVAAWTRTNAGTSFDEDRVTIGANGVGSAATNFLSTLFVGRTWQNGNLVEVKCSEGGLKVKVTEKQESGSGTSVEFIPDFSFFEVDSLDKLDTKALVEDRLISLQMAFPEIKFSFNKKKINVNDLKKFSSLFIKDGETVIIEKTDDLSFFFCPSADGFRTTSFINGVNTRLGGSYVDFIVNGVVDELVMMIKRRHKIEVTKSVVKNGLAFVMFAKNFTNPKFDSQTKERLTNPVSNVKEHFVNCGSKDFKIIAKKIFAAPDIIDPIISSLVAKKESDERRSAILAQKSLKKVKVAKHIAANKAHEGTLFLVEGQSALGFFLKVRNTDLAGAYPLRGVVMNTWDLKPSEVLKNRELSELVAVLGLDITNPNSVDSMTYKNVATLSDADVDGMKISTLLVAFFYKFWPRLFEEKRVHITRSPIMISTKGKEEKWFFSYKEAKEFKESAKGYTHKYLKGLGSLTEEEYDRVLNNPILDTISVDSGELFEMMFGKDSQMRKEFMMA